MSKKLNTTETNEEELIVELVEAGLKLINENNYWKMIVFSLFGLVSLLFFIIVSLLFLLVK